ncbi:epimerase [Candidatus Woesearchaeota archaeon]|nr:epimerase [Candidatus Woesearchaeota archaeon]|tara:strand:+ start:9515 stop:10552 length:1038 start_codon:yes stop_codon:yes gene_type:complete
MTETCLVTGGSGFFGTHLVRKLLEKKRKVRVFDIAEPEEGVRGKVEFFKGDIRDFDSVNKTCKNIDVVYHTVAVVPISKAGKKFDEINAGGTRNILEAALRNKVKSFVHISSTAIYKVPKKGDVITEDYPIMPVGDYGRAKYHAEKICFEYMKKGLNITILRPRTIIGTGRLGIFSILFDWIRRGKNIYILGNGNNLFSYVSASDLAEASILASKKGFGLFLNIGAEEYGTFKGDLKKLVRYAKSKSRFVTINAELTRLILQVLDKIGLSPLTEWHYKTVDKEYVFDVSKAKKVLGWKPKDSNERMFKDTYDWYLKNYKQLDKRIGTTHRFSAKQGILKLLKLFS